MFVRSEDIFNNAGGKPQNVLSFISHPHRPDPKKIENVLGMKLNQQARGIYPAWKNWPVRKSELCGSIVAI